MSGRVRSQRLRRASRSLLGVMSVAALGSCGDAVTTPDYGIPGPSVFASCDLDLDFLFAPVTRDAIPSLDSPEWVRADQEVPDYLDPQTRVIGIEAPGHRGAFAIPHNVLWHHEVVNMSVGGKELAVTYCPLAGSSLVFDRESVQGVELGVSGILFMNNLVLYDRRDTESLWPQLIGEARCGTSTGSKLAHYPFVEMEWAAWLELHPDTWVLSEAETQGFDPTFFDYTALGYPYGAYETVSVWYNGIMPSLDGRRFSKERVIGLPSSGEDPGLAFPFGALEKREGMVQAVPFTFEGSPHVLLWSDEARGGMVFRPFTSSGIPVTMVAAGAGFRDRETGSIWTLEGRAVTGPLEGERLYAFARAHTAFWGAWAAFHPRTRLWEG